jgi:hypothetical protein
MSSALAMILAAGMAVPGIGPEKVSGEVEQALDLRGEWEGNWRLADGPLYYATIDGQFIFGAVAPGEGGILFRVSSFIDEGKGRFRIQPKDDDRRWLGIYEQGDDHVRMCFGEEGKLRPTVFRGGNGQHLIILHRVKSRK